MARRWFVGLNLHQNACYVSTFSQNRRRCFDASQWVEKLFDHTSKRAMDEGLVSGHVSADGTLVPANVSFKSFVLIEVATDPEECRERLRSEVEKEPQGPQDPGNYAVNFRGQKRSTATHRSPTDPDCHFVSKGYSGSGARPGYTVNALMENRHRLLLGLGVEISRSSA